MELEFKLGWMAKDMKESLETITSMVKVILECLMAQLLKENLKMEIFNQALDYRSMMMILLFKKMQDLPL